MNSLHQTTQPAAIVISCPWQKQLDSLNWIQLARASSPCTNMDLFCPLTQFNIMWHRQTMILQTDVQRTTSICSIKITGKKLIQLGDNLLQKIELLNPEGKRRTKNLAP